MLFDFRYRSLITSVVLPLAFTAQYLAALEAAGDPETSDLQSTNAAESELDPPRSPKLMLISWDGAGDVLVDRLLAEGKLPNLAALAERGVRAEHMVGTWPSKTAPSHASIYTGCGPGVHGVTGNMTPYSQDREHHTVLESFRGFSSFALTAEPFFVTTALEGLDTTVLGATQYYPHQPIAEAFKSRKVEGKEPRYRSLSSFEDQLLPSGTLAAGDLKPAAETWNDLPPMTGTPLELELRAGDDTVFGLVFDHPEDPVAGYDSVLLRLNSRDAQATNEAILKPHQASSQTRGWSPGFTVRQGPLRSLLFFRLFHLAPDGSDLVLYRREATAPVGHIPDKELKAYMASGAASYDNSFQTYSRGRLGRPLMLGGDGSAEERLLETVAFDIEQLIANTRFAWTQWSPDALFHYAPYLDHAGHEWMAAMHPQSELFDPEVARMLWSYYSRIAGLMDTWLGALVEMSAGEAIIALVSDHGMSYSTHDVAINRILEEHGLLKRGPDGRIDLSQTKILATDSSFFLRVNDQSWRGGTVTPEERAEVIQQAATALLSIRDPEDGRAVIQRVFNAAEISHLKLDGTGGDLYIDPAPGYYPITGFPDALAGRSGRPWGSGTHGYWRELREMHAIFFAAGPGVAHNVTCPPMSQIDVAPTLAALLGIRSPADSCGRVVYEALKPKPIGPSQSGTVRNP